MLVALAAVAPAALVAQSLPEEKRPVVSEVRYHFEGGEKVDPGAVEAHLRLKVGDVFYYHDLQPGDRFEILANASISGEPKGPYRYEGVNRGDVSPPRGAPF